ncbi:GDYXXLXY domain-containing protein [Xanthobacter oligotrophicus]|uniref:GDYXXLXY domain-containing protein n=1 Tax=Xanthobacter oligotrophicus TaxID=2607286 RepID=UPI0011F25382|nr:GDYXXLXY domain-containing protein [Xanthobacter oligotrophicus]MCG5233732.1 GDYXXLXY domain-containing protein [Xanthobacter oligotrophicus]
MKPLMRRALFLAAGLVVLVTLGWSVRDFEALTASGDMVLLELAPADPRSLIQGDYMRLAYAVERQEIHLDAPAGTIILGLDERRIGRFRRLGSTVAHGPGETAFRVRRTASGDGVTVEPHSFLFQEGQADLYAKARYGIFRVDAGGRHLLVGLADADARKIEPR